MGGPGNLCLRWCVDIYESAMKKEWDIVKEKQIRMDKLCDRLWSSADSPYMVIKYVLSRAGICSDKISSPLRAVSTAEKKIIDAIVEEYSDVLDSPIMR
jgi:dihydrodipicolinate synthase/N-acetylneuraminate lyase